ncbi:MAG TPA: TerC/Alx family metal homeostasis membrane protein [Phycisphaerales bacterium]|nr:TerC/Alx family metal homeostasis membrane protein [Phycisphaerales bacterium]
MTQTLLWTGFVVFVLAMLFIDLFIVSRGKGGEQQVVPPKKALGITAIFVSLALMFGGVVYMVYDRGLMGEGVLAYDGKTPMTGAIALGEYLQVWMLEYAMSVDNLFVFTLVFSFFRVPAQYQHRVLFWGILGALILRGVMIGIGSAVVQAFAPVLILFGVVLILTAFKMLKASDDQFDPSKSLAIKIAKKFFPVTDTIDCEKFFVNAPVGPLQADGTCRVVRAATPLFLVLCVVEATDLLFAVDSIPAAFGTSKQAFIIFTANVFAIMGLRSLYFAIAGLIDMFRYLKPALAGILLFIGAKLMLAPELKFIRTGTDDAGNATHWTGFHVPTEISLGIIVALLVGGIVASLLHKPKKPVEHKQ